MLNSTVVPTTCGEVAVALQVPLLRHLGGWRASLERNDAQTEALNVGCTMSYLIDRLGADAPTRCCVASPAPMLWPTAACGGLTCHIDACNTGVTRHDFHFQCMDP